MDFLECKICNNPYDEEDHRPRQAPCGHGLCSVCLGTLIKESIFECPKCRKKTKVDVREDLPVNFDLIDIIRAFKNENVLMPKKTDDEVCNIHCKPIGHWCYKCQIWICDLCLDSHSTLIGCSTANSANAMQNLKDENIENADILLSKFNKDTMQVFSKIHDHNKRKREHLEKAEKLCEEVKKLRRFVELGNTHKNDLVENKRQLQEANSPHAVSNKIKELTQRKQTLLSWSAKSLTHSQFDLPKFDRHQMMISEGPSLVFFELSTDDAVEGRVIMRLQNLPDIRKYIVNIMIGQSRTSLFGTTFEKNTNKSMYTTGDFPFRGSTLTLDNKGRTLSARGYVRGAFNGKKTSMSNLDPGYNGYLYRLYFDVGDNGLERGQRVVGHIEKGLEFIQWCHDTNLTGLKITDCGLVSE